MRPTNQADTPIYQNIFQGVTDLRNDLQQAALSRVYHLRHMMNVLDVMKMDLELEATRLMDQFGIVENVTTQATVENVDQPEDEKYDPREMAERLTPYQADKPRHI